MSEQEKFLERWSRRKREGEVAPAAGDKPESAAPEQQRVTARDPAATPPAPAKDEAPFDLASLPSLDSIGPNSDIRAFLRPGVPPALSRAALRRAWVADPAIRDFVGLAENAWDFTVTNEAMGFGPLNMDAAQIAEQVKMVFGGPKPEPEAPEEPDVAQIPQSAPQDATVRRSEHAALRRRKKTAKPKPPERPNLPRPRMRTATRMLRRKMRQPPLPQSDAARMAAHCRNSRFHPAKTRHSPRLLTLPDTGRILFGTLLIKRSACKRFPGRALED